MFNVSLTLTLSIPFHLSLYFSFSIKHLVACHTDSKLRNEKMNIKGIISLSLSLFLRQAQWLAKESLDSKLKL